MKNPPNELLPRKKRSGKYKKRYQQILSELGSPVGSVSPSKRNIIFLGNNYYDSRKLYTFPLTVLEDNLGANNNNIANRDRMVADVVGWDMYYTLANEQPVFPIGVTFAVLGLRNGVGVIPTTGSTTVLDWFRGSGNDRSIEFSNLYGSNELLNLPINTDKYVILSKWKHVLGPNVNGATSKHMPNNNFYTFKKTWIPFNRQVKYKDADSTAPEDGRVFLAMWCDLVTATPASVSVATAALMDLKITCYFREP